MTLPNVPLIDNRVSVVGIARLRKVSHEYLEALADNALLIQGNEDKPLAVLVSYDTWLAVQEQLKASGQ